MQSQNYYIGPSQIHGNGLMAKHSLSINDRIGPTHINDQTHSNRSWMYNHSETPNARSEKNGDKRYIRPLRKIEEGEEITLDYRFQPELEQPSDFQGVVNPWATTTQGFKGELDFTSMMQRIMQGSPHRNVNVYPYGNSQTINTPDGPIPLNIAGLALTGDIPIGKNWYVSPSVGVTGVSTPGHLKVGVRPSFGITWSNAKKNLSRREEGGSIKDVHDAADSAGMEWDNNSEFMAFSKRITGKEHIDDMTPTERRILINAIRNELPIAQNGNKGIIEPLMLEPQQPTLEQIEQEKKWLEQRQILDSWNNEFLLNNPNYYVNDIDQIVELPIAQGGGITKVVKPAVKYIKKNIYEPLIESFSESALGKYAAELGLFSNPLKSQDYLKPGMDYIKTQKEVPSVEQENLLLNHMLTNMGQTIQDPQLLLPKYASVQRQGIQHRLKAADKLDKISDPDFKIKGKPATVDIIKTSEWPKHAKNLGKIHGVPKRQLENVKKYMDEEGIKEIATKDLINRIDQEMSYDIDIIPRFLHENPTIARKDAFTQHDPILMIPKARSEMIFNRGTDSEHSRGFLKFTDEKVYEGGTRQVENTKKKSHFTIPYQLHETHRDGHVPQRVGMDYYWNLSEPELSAEDMAGMTEADYMFGSRGLNSPDRKINYFRKKTKGLASPIPITREEYTNALEEYSKREAFQTTKEYESPYSLPEYKTDPDWQYMEAEIVTPDIRNKNDAHFSTNKSPRNKGENNRILGHVRYYININPNSPEYLNVKVGELQSDILQDRSDYLGNYLRYSPSIKTPPAGSEVGRVDEVLAGRESTPIKEQIDENLIKFQRQVKLAQENYDEHWNIIKKMQSESGQLWEAQLKLQDGLIGIPTIIMENGKEILQYGMMEGAYTNPSKYIRGNGEGIQWVTKENLPFNSKMQIEVKEPEYWKVKDIDDNLKKEQYDIPGNPGLYHGQETMSHSVGTRNKTGDEVIIWKKKNILGQTKYYVEYQYTKEITDPVKGSIGEIPSLRRLKDQIEERELSLTREATVGEPKINEENFINGDVQEITKDKFYSYVDKLLENQNEFITRRRIGLKESVRRQDNSSKFRKNEVKKAEQELVAYESSMEDYINQNEFYKYLAEDNKWVDVFHKAFIQKANKWGARSVDWPHYETAATMQTHQLHSSKIAEAQAKLNTSKVKLQTEQKKAFEKANQLRKDNSGLTVGDKIEIRENMQIFEEDVKAKEEALSKLTEVSRNKKGKITQEIGKFQSSPVEYFYQDPLPKSLARTYSEAKSDNTNVGSIFQPIIGPHDYKWTRQELSKDVMDIADDITFKEGGSVTPWNTFMVLPPEVYIGQLPEYQWGGLVKGAKAIGPKAKKYISEGFHKAYDPVSKWFEERFGDHSELNQRLLRKHTDAAGYIHIIPPGKGGPVAPALRATADIIKQGLSTGRALGHLGQDIYKAGKTELFGANPEDLPAGFGYEPFTLQEQKLQKAIRLLGKEMYKHQAVLEMTDDELAYQGVDLKKSQNALSFLKLMTEGQASILNEQQFESLTGKKKSELPAMIDRFEKRITHLQGLAETKKPKDAQTIQEELDQTAYNTLPSTEPQQLIVPTTDPDVIVSDVDIDFSSAPDEVRWTRDDLVGHLNSVGRNIYWNDLSQRARTMLVSDIRRNFGNTVDGERVDHQWVKELWQGLNPENQAPYIERILMDPFFTATQRNMFGSTYNIPNSQLNAFDNITAARDVNTAELSESDMHEYLDYRVSAPRERDINLWESDRTWLFDESGDPAAIWNISRVMDAVNGSTALNREEVISLLAESKGSMDATYWDSFWLRYGPDVQNTWPINIQNINETITQLGEQGEAITPMSVYIEPLYNASSLSDMLENLADTRDVLRSLGGRAWQEFLNVHGNALRIRWSMENTTNEELDALLSRRVVEEEALEGVDEALPHDNTIDLNRILPGHSPRITTRVDPQADEGATADPDWDTILPVTEYDRTLPLIDGSQEPTPFMRFTSVPRGGTINIDAYEEDLYNLDVHVASLSDAIQTRYAEISNGRRPNEGTHDWAERVENLPWEDWYNEGLSQVGFMEWELANSRIPAASYFIRLDRLKRLEAWLHGPNDALLNPTPNFVQQSADLQAEAAARARPAPEIPDNFSIDRNSREDYISDLIMYRGDSNFEQLDDLPIPVQSAIAIMLRKVPELADGRGTNISRQSFAAAVEDWENPEMSINDYSIIFNDILTHPFITQNEKRIVGEFLDIPSDVIHSLYTESQRVGRRNLLNHWGSAVSWDALGEEGKNVIRHAKYYGTLQSYPEEAIVQESWDGTAHKGKVLIIADGIKRRNMPEEIRSKLMEMLDLTYIEKSAVQMLGRRMDSEPINWEGGFGDDDGARLINQQATEVAESIADGGVMDEAEALKVLANGMNEFGEWVSGNTSAIAGHIVLPEAFYQTLAEELDIQPADVLEHIRNTRRLGYPLTPNADMSEVETTDPADVQRAMGQTEQWRQRNMDLANEHTGADMANESIRRGAVANARGFADAIRGFVGQTPLRQKYQNIGNTKVGEAIQKYGPGSGFINKHIKELNAKVNSKASKKVGIAPESDYRNYESLIGSLFYRQGDPVIKKLAEGWTKVEKAKPGKIFAGASSLSGDSYRAVLWFMNKYGFGTKKNPKHMLSVQWHGWDTLNDSEFARSAGIPQSVTVNELNDYMKKINEKLPHGKKMPYAYKRGEDIYIPRLTFEKLDNTPDKKMGGTIYDKYDKTLFIYQMGGAITDKEKQHLLTGYGITVSPEPGEIEVEEETIQIDGEPIHKELALDIYKKYIQGTYANSSQEEKAAKVYDKINRLYYKDAKNAGISVGNFVLSKVIQEGIYS